jgi:hypothetical protein
MIIYKITNLITLKEYVGQTTLKLSIRWTNHCQKSTGLKYLYRSICKHGKENFSIGIIDTATSIEELNTKEIYWIKELNTLAPNGYNLSLGGGNAKLTEEHKANIGKALRALKLKRTPAQILKTIECRAGSKHTQEAKDKVSRANKGRIKSPEAIQASSNKQKNKIISQETKDKISKANKGHKSGMTGRNHSEKTRFKMSLASRGIKKDHCKGLIQPIINKVNLSRFKITKRNLKSIARLNFKILYTLNPYQKSPNYGWFLRIRICNIAPCTKRNTFAFAWDTNPKAGRSTTWVIPYF